MGQAPDGAQMRASGLQDSEGWGAEEWCQHDVEGGRDGNQSAGKEAH